MTILEYYKEEQLVGSTNERQAARRNWFRAVVETLHERSLSAAPMPARRPRDGQGIVVRFEPYWHKVSDDELYELLNYLAPYFKRPENRGQSLE